MVYIFNYNFKTYSYNFNLIINDEKDYEIGKKLTKKILEEKMNLIKSSEENKQLSLNLIKTKNFESLKNILENSNINYYIFNLETLNENLLKQIRKDSNDLLIGITTINKKDYNNIKNFEKFFNSLIIINEEILKNLISNNLRKKYSDLISNYIYENILSLVDIGLTNFDFNDVKKILINGKILTLSYLEINLNKNDFKNLNKLFHKNILFNKEYSNNTKFLLNFIIPKDFYVEESKKIFFNLFKNEETNLEFSYSIRIDKNLINKKIKIYFTITNL